MGKEKEMSETEAATKVDIDTPPPELCYESTARKLLGLTPGGFAKLGLSPVKVIRNPHYSRLNAYLYDRAQIQELAASPRVAMLRPRPRKPHDYDGDFRAEYVTPSLALRDAALAMFNLNRYCKHHTCHSNNRDEIYALKNSFMRLLYRLGLCDRAYRHVDRFPALVRRNCGGTGRDFQNGYKKEACSCHRCNGTGIFRPALEDRYIVMSFVVEGRRYTWHQPEELIDYPVQLTDEDLPMSETTARPLGIPRRELTRCKALVRWVIDGLWSRDASAHTCGAGGV